MSCTADIILKKGETVKIIPNEDVKVSIIATKLSEPVPSVIISNHNNSGSCTCVDCSKEEKIEIH